MLRTRIAPTPSGYLHIGNAFSFLLTALHARKHNGSILLRIDDIDDERKRTEYVEDIFTSLEWLGIEWQEGPTGPGDFEQNWSQHKRLDLYSDLLNRLQEARIVFACECSRKKLASLEGYAYPGTCDHLRIPLDTPDTAWRMHVPPNRHVKFNDLEKGAVDFDLGAHVGSFVVRKKDQLPSYQVVSLADDVHFRINYIVRGEDLLSSTAMQLYMAEKLNLDAFRSAQFLHHKLEKDEQGHKLSKTAGSISLQYMRKHGIGPSQVYRLFAEQFLGLEDQRIETFAQLADIDKNHIG
jgi:glutamyl-tRNA synthetase